MFFESTLLNFIAFMAYVAIFTKLMLMGLEKLTGKKYPLIKENPKAQRHCNNCGFEGKAKSKPGGSTFWTVFWVIFFLPFGLIYWVSRYGNPVYSCPKCQSHNMIPLDSPILKKEA